MGGASDFKYVISECVVVIALEGIYNDTVNGAEPYWW